MITGLIIVAALATVIVYYVISTKRKFAVLNENLSNAISQIGVQLSSRFDALIALLNLTGKYAEHESKNLIEKVKSQRRFITTLSAPEDVMKQERIISEALDEMYGVIEQYPELMANETYLKTIDAVLSYEKMIRKSSLIYNDRVTNFNRDIKKFPASIIAGILGFSQREYLTERESLFEMSAMERER